MSSALRAAAPHWITGLALAVTGVAIARLFAPTCATTQTQALVAVTGELTALAGLAVILLGIRRRLHSAAVALASTARPDSIAAPTPR